MEHKILLGLEIPKIVDRHRHTREEERQVDRTKKIDKFKNNSKSIKMMVPDCEAVSVKIKKVMLTCLINENVFPGRENHCIIYRRRWQHRLGLISIECQKRHTWTCTSIF